VSPSLGVVVWVVVLLPGAAFVFALQRDVVHARPSGLDSHVPIALAIAITAALVANSLWYFAWKYVCIRIGAPWPDAQAFFSLVGGGNANSSSAAIRSLSVYPVRIAAYFCSLAAFGALAGSLARYVLRTVRGGRDIVLWGKLLFPSGTPFVRLTFDVELGGVSVLVSGWLRNYAVDRNGELERVVLARTIRRPLDVSGNGLDKAWVRVDGEFFVVRLGSTKTVKVDYFLPR
jgi:hypothetical protein